jgi:hypothetical protein
MAGDCPPGAVEKISANSFVGPVRGCCVVDEEPKKSRSIRSDLAGAPGWDDAVFDELQEEAMSF